MTNRRMNNMPYILKAINHELYFTGSVLNTKGRLKNDISIFSQEATSAREFSTTEEAGKVANVIGVPVEIVETPL
jgi:hypothetical protein